jgi:hypothetical protein
MGCSHVFQVNTTKAVRNQYDWGAFLQWRPSKVIYDPLVRQVHVVSDI